MGFSPSGASPVIPCFSSHPSPAPSWQQLRGQRTEGQRQRTEGLTLAHEAPWQGCKEPSVPSAETSRFFLPCLPRKALTRVHFIDSFMTLTIPPVTVSLKWLLVFRWVRAGLCSSFYFLLLRRLCLKQWD